MQNIKIGGMEWEVCLDSDSQERLSEEQHFGSTHLQYQKFLLTISHKPQQQKSTMLHEIIHAVSFTFMPGKLALAEDQVKVLANGLYQVLRDNPWVVDFITNDERLT